VILKLHECDKQKEEAGKAKEVKAQFPHSSRLPLTEISLVKLAHVMSLVNAQLSNFASKWLSALLPRCYSGDYFCQSRGLPSRYGGKASPCFSAKEKK